MIEISLWLVVGLLACYSSVIGTMVSTISRKNKEIDRLERRAERKSLETTKLPVKALVPGLTIIDRGIRVAVETHPAYKGGGGGWQFDVAPVEVVAKTYTTSYTSGDFLVEVERYE